MRRTDCFETGHDRVHGAFTISLGFTRDDALVEMVWRFQDQDAATVFPITAYFPLGLEDGATEEKP